MAAALPPYHPVIDLWPPLQNSETENVRDLLKKGVKQDLRTWKDANGKEWLVSGREWHVAAGELAATELLRTVDIGMMSEVDMIEYIIFGPNGCTKSGIGDGQKAVVALLAHNLIAKCVGQKVLAPVGKECKKLAVKAGVNHAYIYNAITLQKQAPSHSESYFVRSSISTLL